MKLKSYKSLYTNLKKNYDKNINDIKEIYAKNNEKRDDFTLSLLAEKSQLEKDNVTLKTRSQDLKSQLLSAEEKIFRLNEENNCLKTKAEQFKLENKKIKNSISGYVTSKNLLNQKLGEKNMYIKLLEDKLKKYGVKNITMNELLEYNRTKKSPIKMKRVESEK